MKMCPFKKYRLLGQAAGFTLLEVLVAMMLLATCLAGIITTFISARRYVQHARNRLQATNLAREKLEELYKDIREDTWNGGNLSPLPFYPDEPITLPNTNIVYTRNYTVEAVPACEYRKVTVRVKWNDPAP